MKQLQNGTWVLDAMPLGEPLVWEPPPTARSLAEITRGYMLPYYPVHSAEARGEPRNLDEAAANAKQRLAEKEKRLADELGQAETEVETLQRRIQERRRARCGVGGEPTALASWR